MNNKNNFIETCASFKVTPILKGKDARRFLEQMKENDKKVTPKEEIERIKANAAKLQAILK